MSKTSIKVIKRKDLEAAANDNNQDLSESKFAETVSGEKVERGLHRKMTNTVSNWIAERRKNNRREEVSAFHQLFGDGFTSSRAV